MCDMCRLFVKVEPGARRTSMVGTADFRDRRSLFRIHTYYFALMWEPIQLVCVLHTTVMPPPFLVHHAHVSRGHGQK